MKARNVLFLILICILSLCVFTGLLVYAFSIQGKKDNEDRTKQINENNLTQEETDDTDVSVTVTPSGTVSSEDSQEEGLSPAVTSVTPTPAITSQIVTEPIVLGFAGDVNFDENSYPALKYDSEDKGILGCLSKELVTEMNAMDIMMLNNEFSYSARGTKTPDKSYTFRADPSRVDILKEMGVDIVSLANNHALDYGPDALVDTFDTLDSAGIDYVGAGENLDRAKAPTYYTVGDKKIAFLSASRVVFAMDWYATDTQLGMIGTYDPTLILESVKEAKANSDYVVIFVHWGVERENYPVDYQRTLAQQYIDAGADTVIGCHPHVMQGFEYYKGKPIAYSLGNYIFTRKTGNSGLLKLYLDPDGTVRMQLRPAAYKDTFTYMITEETEKKDYFDFMKEISYNVNIDADGFITPTE